MHVLAPIAAGNAALDLRFKLTSAGAAVQLPVGTTVVLRMVEATTGEVRIASGAGVVLDVDAGEFGYDFSVSDVSKPGRWRLQFTVTRPGSDPFKCVPFVLPIVESL